MPSADPELQVQ